MFFTPCAIAGYMIYPYINEIASAPDKEEKAVQNKPEIELLNTVSPDEVVGTWILSPRSMGLLSNSLGTSGRRLSFSLESWGGGDANFVIGKRHIQGPIAWHTTGGRGTTPASLHINSSGEEFTLQFSKLEKDLVLVAKVDSVGSGKKGFLRFLKAS